MATGYWLINSTLTNPESFAEYAKAIVPWIDSVGGRIIAKDLNLISVKESVATWE